MTLRNNQGQKSKAARSKKGPDGESESEAANGGTKAASEVGLVGETDAEERGRRGDLERPPAYSFGPSPSQ